MTQRDLQVISSYIETLRNQAEYSDKTADIDNILFSIKNLISASSPNNSAKLSITLPSPESMRCNICSKTVINR